MRWMFTVIALTLAAALSGCALEEDCPKCEQECWEGGAHCTKCKKRNGCPLDAAPGAGEGEGAAPDLAELPAA